MHPLEEKLDYRFQDPRLLEQALTHSSYANERLGGALESNERLEFLGDSVLGQVTADHLYRSHPDLPEGDLTRMRAALVCEEALAKVARRWGLGEYLRLGRGEDQNGGRQRDSILADAVEAIAKAIDNAKAQGEKPSVIVLNTIKGKGYHKIENSASNHNMNISAEQVEEALADIAAERAAIEAE